MFKLSSTANCAVITFEHLTNKQEKQKPERRKSKLSNNWNNTLSL